MVDMLARLFTLPDVVRLRENLQTEGIVIRRPHPLESEVVTAWVFQNFSDRWAGECRGAIEHRPPTCFIATEIQALHEPTADPYNLPLEKLIGFACYETVAKGMFGPEGIHPDYRGRAIGKALLLTCLHAMADMGYGYAVIPWVGPIEFYEKTVGAIIIPDSEPGIFRGALMGVEQRK